MLAKLHNVLTRLCIVGTSAAFAVLIFAVLLQVIGRTLGDSPVWTEELTRFALLYLTAFGLGLSLTTGDLVNVDILCNRLPDKFARMLRIFSTSLISLFAALLIYPAYRFTEIGQFQTSPALGWRMDFIHASVLLLLLTLLVFSLLRLVLMLSGATDGQAKALHENIS